MFRPTSVATIDDLRSIARRRVPEFAFRPLEAGGGDGSGPIRNIEALGRFLLTSRALVDVETVRQGTTIFGRTYSSPFGISAVGYANIYRRHADQLLAEAAAEANIPFMLSGGSAASIEEIARIAPDHVWQQLYAARDPAITDDIVRRARDAGVQVLVYTADSPLRPRVDWLVRKGIALPAAVRWGTWPYIVWQAARHPAWSLAIIRQGGLPRQNSWAPYAPPLSSAADIARCFSQQVPNVKTWKEVERVRRLWPSKLVVKGLMHPDDVRFAIGCGADAVIVSNHGGNNHDRMAASIDQLGVISRATHGRMSVFFDGGVRKGADILTALALGAQFVFVGRATLYGVIAGGLAGARRAIAILQDEIERGLMLIGCPDAGDMSEAFLASSADGVSQ